VRRLAGRVFLVVALALVPVAAHAEFQVKPFGGITFGGNTTFVDFDQVAGSAKLNLGVSAVWLGEIIGIEGDVATTSGFFTGSGDDRLVLRSHAATFTGNVVVAMPRRIARYGLRPYAVAGFGMMHVGLFDRIAAIPFGDALAAWDFGGGATGFLNDYVGLNWDVRMFRTLAGREVAGFSIAPEQLSFWRATMGLAIRL
jgi:hypothetical protein